MRDQREGGDERPPWKYNPASCVCAANTPDLSSDGVASCKLCPVNRERERMCRQGESCHSVTE